MSNFESFDIYIISVCYVYGRVFFVKGVGFLVVGFVNVSCFLCFNVLFVMIVSVDLSEKYLNTFIEEIKGFYFL